MNSIAEYFEKNRYVYLTEALSKEDCAKLTEYMFSLKEQGKLTHDPQCPLSWSIYSDPVLDSVLENLCKPLSQQLGIELLPTYTYARIYEPGEVLKRHVDRESCEISGTLTLGHDPESEIWPIYFSEDPKDPVGRQVTIGVGDLVMYRGNELNHWRPAYIGKWQVQVFFHYVDANGPHKEWAYDKRKPVKEEPKLMKQVAEESKNKLALYTDLNVKYLDESCPGASSFYSKFKPELAFTREECDRIVSMAQTKYPTKSRVGGKVDTYAPEIRRVEQYVIDHNENTKWIFDKILTAVSIANEEYFKFDLLGITHGLQLLHYKSVDESFYDWHADVGEGPASRRKLSVSVMLSDESDYEGGDLIINNYGANIVTCKEKGSINMFPSYLTHTVTPVTKGDRWVIVIWIHGTQRFR